MLPSLTLQPPQYQQQFEQKQQQHQGAGVGGAWGTPMATSTQVGGGLYNMRGGGGGGGGGMYGGGYGMEAGAIMDSGLSRLQQQVCMYIHV